MTKKRDPWWGDLLTWSYSPVGSDGWPSWETTYNGRTLELQRMRRSWSPPITPGWYEIDPYRERWFGHGQRIATAKRNAEIRLIIGDEHLSPRMSPCLVSIIGGGRPVSGAHTEPACHWRLADDGRSIAMRVGAGSPILIRTHFKVPADPATAPVEATFSVQGYPWVFLWPELVRGLHSHGYAFLDTLPDGAS